MASRHVCNTFVADNEACSDQVVTGNMTEASKSTQTESLHNLWVPNKYLKAMHIFQFLLSLQIVITVYTSSVEFLLMSPYIERSLF